MREAYWSNMLIFVSTVYYFRVQLLSGLGIKELVFALQ
jgi:hypothetical protein